MLQRGGAFCCEGAGVGYTLLAAAATHAAGARSLAVATTDRGTG